MWGTSELLFAVPLCLSGSVAMGIWNCGIIVTECVWVRGLVNWSSAVAQRDWQGL